VIAGRLRARARKIALSSLVLAGLLTLAGVPDGAAWGQVPADTLSRERVQVVYGPGDSLRAARILDLLDPPPVLPSLPPELPAAATVVLAPDETSFQGLTGGRTPEWGAAVALPAERIILLPAYPTRRLAPADAARVILHEWAHLGLHDYMGDLRIPRWFSEGYAEWASGGWDVEQGWRLRVAIALNRAPPLDSLELGWPRDRAAAEVAYLLAGSAVAYLARSGGPEGLGLFLQRWRDSGRFEEALRRTYGVTVGQLEEDWAKHVRQEYGWLLVITRSAIFWAFLVAVLAVMLTIRRRFNRERMARLRAVEPPDAPAWWEPSVDLPGRNNPGRMEPPDIQRLERDP
jgi:hypothetical protein